MNKASAYVNLVAQTSVCHLQKNMPPSSLEKWLKKKKWLLPDLRQGKYKLNLEKQCVLLCPKERDQRIMEACQSHTAGRGSAGQIMTIHEPK